MLDLTRPTAILLLAVLDHVSDLDEARRIVARACWPRRRPPGSFAGYLPRGQRQFDPDETSEMISRLNEHLAEASFVGRPRDAVARFFDGLDLVGPGVGPRSPSGNPLSELTASARTSLCGGMARKAGGGFPSEAETKRELDEKTSARPSRNSISSVPPRSVGG